MEISPKELKDQGFELLDELDHNKIVPFLQVYLKKKNKYSIFYYACNILFIGLVLFVFFKDFNSSEYNLGRQFTHFSYGLAISILLLPLHEYIHVLAYKSQGAKNTSYDANLKKFYFMALADKFVASRKEFIRIALAPFLLISAVLVFFLLFVNDGWILTILSILFAHTAMCSGDFGLLSYFEFHKDSELITYDDIEKKESYFYYRKHF